VPCSCRGHIAYVNQAVRIPRYRGLQGSTVTVLIRCPIFAILLTGSFVELECPQLPPLMNKKPIHLKCTFNQAQPYLFSPLKKQDPSKF
jgi:hypothetical protein